MRRKEHNALGQKECARCRVYKDLDDFGKNSRNWDGKHTYCRICWADMNARASGREGKSYNPKKKYKRQLVSFDWINPDHKRCSYCLEFKYKSCFSRDSTNNDGLNRRCKECASLEKAEAIAHMPPEKRGRIKRQRRAQRLEKTYNLTLVEYDLMYLDQDGKCAICREPSENTLNVDHAHKTGEVRGLLCFDCNILLGKAKDSIDVLKAIDILKSAIAYLEQHHEA